MSPRTPALVLSMTFLIQPTGWALPADPSSTWGHMLGPMAAVWSGVETSMYSMLPQADPRQAVALLPLWQRMLGPDPYGRDVLAVTLAQQQQLAYQRLTARGGQSIPYFLSLATSIGESASIVEANWSRCGMMRTGTMRTTAQGNQFMWQVQLAQRTVTLFRTGASCTGDRLGTFSTSLAQGAIAAASPAHTIVSFNYSGTETH